MNIVQYFQNRVKRHPNKVFLVEELEGAINRQFTYLEFYETARRMAGNLAWAGITARDRVALVMPNSPELVTTWFALNSLGAVVCPIDHIITDEEKKKRIEYLEPKIIITPDNYRDFLKEEAPPPANITAVEPRDPASIIFSSGTTTNDPKGVVESHYNYILAGEGFCHWFGVTRQDRLYTCLSLSRINAQAYSVMGAVAAGATVIIGSKFSGGKSFWPKIKNTRATVANMIGGMLGDLYKQSPNDEERDHALRVIANAQVISDGDLHEELEDRFDANIAITYGSTEQLFGFTTPITPHQKKANCMGKQKRHPSYLEHDFMAMVVNEEGATLNTAGEVGKLMLRTPFLTEYWRKPELTAKRWNRNMWYDTQDIVRFDDEGNFYYVGRSGDRIRKSGNWVTPLDIESIVFKHPKVLEVAVIAVTQDSFGEPHVKAFVVPKAGETLTPQELIEYCRDKMAVFNMPDEWQIEPSGFVRTSTERTQKSLLR